MTSITTALLVAASLSALGASPVFAQSDGAVPGRVEVAVGPLWVGSQKLGDQAANETTSSGDQLALFSTSSELASRAGVEGRVGVKLWRSLEVEASGTYATPEIRTQVSADFEGAAPTTIAERIQQYTFAGGLVWYPVSRSGSRAAPFVTAGGGYLRQLHEAATLAVTGQFYQFGGGVKFLIASRPASRLKGIGVRVDARAVVRANGVAFGDRRAVSPALGASLFARF